MMPSLSHVSATFGSWRLSQQSLRSFIENSLCAIYYIDHPIELKLWEDEKFRIGFKEISKYVASHPYISRYKCVLDSIGDLDNEYSELSKSVHGSARDVRMTDQVSDILLWDSSIARYGKWTTRQRGAMSGIVILFLAMFERKFKGAQHLEIRRALNFVLTPKKIRNVVEQLRINIPKIHPN